MPITLDVPMVVMKKKTEQQRSTPVRLSEEAIKWSRIASGYTGESMVQYVSRIVAERARGDVDRLHAETLKTKAR